MDLLPKDIHGIIFDKLPNCYLFLMRFTCRTFRDSLITVLTEATAAEFCSSGDMKVILFLQQTLKWKFNDTNYSLKAIVGNHLELFKWLWVTKNDCEWSDDVYSFAGLYGRLDILKWMIETVGHKSNAMFSSRAAAYGGHFELIDWCEGACGLGDILDSELYVFAAGGGQIEFLKRLRETRERRHISDPFTCTAAAINGELTVLKWLRENGYPWDAHTCAFAAECGQLEVLKWLRENGCPWNEHTCAYAEQAGATETLEWAVKNGCPCRYVQMYYLQNRPSKWKKGYEEGYRALVERRLQLLHLQNYDFDCIDEDPLDD